VREISRDEGQDQDRLRDNAAAFTIYGHIGVELALLLGHVIGGIRFEGEQRGEEVHW
jgi:hypothetical protein